ncbi:MAG TPA: helix-turn-helix transcriptional regulator, partial [Burkholderiaceae bacterium]|nr:helix-turn-helix transcriptional regulator [Burkholderiaceae bacterium]
RLDAAQRTTLARVAAILHAARRAGAVVAIAPASATSTIDVGGTVAARTPAAGHACLDPLTEREREVLQRMAAGDSNKLIARAFDLSPHTVKRHVANILGKLGVETRGQAAACWHDHAGP